MRAAAIVTRAQHRPITYLVERVPHAYPYAVGVWDGVVVVAETADAEADIAFARKHLESLGLLDCGCCGVEAGLQK